VKEQGKDDHQRRQAERDCLHDVTPREGPRSDAIYPPVLYASTKAVQLRSFYEGGEGKSSSISKRNFDVKIKMRRRGEHLAQNSQFGKVMDGPDVGETKSLLAVHWRRGKSGKGALAPGVLTLSG